MAVKVIEVPGHTEFAEAATDTATGRLSATVMVTAFEVAGLPMEQGVALEVRRQVTASPSTGVKVKVVLFVPALVPFTFHW